MAKMIGEITKEELSQELTNEIENKVGKFVTKTGTSFDDLRESGFFYFGSNTGGSPTSSTTQQFYCICQFLNNDGWQISKTRITGLNDVYYRECRTGVWGAWQRFARGEEISILNGQALLKKGDTLNDANFDLWNNSIYCGVYTVGNHVNEFYRWATLLIYSGEAYINQQLTKSDGTIYTRTYNGIKFSSWKQLATTDKVDISLPLNSGFTLDGAKECRITKVNNLVRVGISVGRTGTGVDFGTVATLPVGYRPPLTINSQCRLYAPGGKSFLVGHIEIPVSGTVNISTDKLIDGTTASAITKAWGYVEFYV